MNIGLRFLMVFLLSLLASCTSSEEKKLITNNSVKLTDGQLELQRNTTEAFKEYWHNGKAEITSYKLMQERYGEIREGTAVTVFVTEDFLPDAQVKTDSKSVKKIAVLKLNRTKNFNTGIYPYSIMTSIFNPIFHSAHALKVSTSIQEWCGQVYMQLNNRQNFEVNSHSYFEGEGDQKFNLPKTWLEDEIWNIIRLNPAELPIGDLKMIPSFEYLRFQHKEVKEHSAFATIKQGESITIYTIYYPSLQRRMSFSFHNKFPYEIEEWEEINVTDQNDTLRLRTTATKMERIKTDYWNQNKSKFSHLRDSLKLN